MFGNLFDKIKKWFSRDKAPIHKSDLEMQITSLIDGFQSFILLCEDAPGYTESMVKSLPGYKNDKNRQYVQLYSAFYKQLCPTAQRMESRDMFSAVIATMKSMQSALVEIRHNAQYLTAPEINENNMRISHVTILQFVKLAEIMGDFAAFMYMALLDELCDDFDKNDHVLPQYRYDNIKKHLDLTILMINQHFNVNIFKDVTASIDELKKEGKDILVFLEDGSHNADLAETLNSNTAIIQGFNFGNLTMNPFLVIGRAYHDMVHLKMIRTQKQKAWMQARVALLKAKMNGLDPESKEYLDLEKLIETYSNMITEIDQKLEKYFIDEES